MARTTLPQLAGDPVVADGGLETDLIYHHGVDLPEFAAFPLVDDEKGSATLEAYYQAYVEIARRADVAAQLDTPTWRASADWGIRLGYSADDLRRLNHEAVVLLARVRDRSGLEQFAISGAIGPKGDGYVAGEVLSPDVAQAYHAPQVETLAAAGADIVSAITMTAPGEAIGIARAARGAGVRVAIAFTVEVDGRLPDGTGLADAVRTVDAEAAPDYFMVNCAHPQHIAPGLDDGGDPSWRERIRGLRVNASTMSHAELDESEELDEGDPDELARDQDRLRPLLPNVSLLGGCCGTDARHVAAMWSA